MNSPAHGVATGECTLLRSGWEIASAAPGGLVDPDPAALEGLSWIAAPTLGTVAAVLRAAGRWNFECNERFDASDWWYRLRFSAGSAEGRNPTLRFDGLATVADAWLNGRHVLASDNMFIAHALREELRSDDNELLLRFRSLDALLQTRRPRPRWRAPMVGHQQLRWFRTTLLGRTPGWSPPAAAVGPWRPIRIESGAALTLEDPQLQTSVAAGTGLVAARARLLLRSGIEVQTVALVVARDGVSHRLELNVTPQTDALLLAGELRIPHVHLWWPHTHGEPALYAARLEVRLADRAGPLTLAMGRIGFRTLSVDLAGGNFALRVNGERIFCRGACWTPPDVVGLDTTAVAAAQVIGQMVAAGMNMVRVSGTMVYENDAFLDTCDARGLLLWQDFMFANMDYPDQDENFRASVSAEARQQLARFAGRPSLAVLCGNSEAEQQAAMWGTARENWSPPLFHDLLPRLCASHAPGIPYWPSSAHGGAFPHQANVGTSSYYGVGAYLRPLEDARRAEVRFATECLAFANVPEETDGSKVHSPLWKSRVPRDLGAGWDFDDVRDHYLRELFDREAASSRYAEHDRYLEFSRVVSGEVMAAAFREWRRARSTCNGALIWFLRDLWPGAGWGILDSSGHPKCPYYLLARLLQPRTVFMTDEGGNGLYAHVVNETGHELKGTLELSLVPVQGRSVHRHRSISVAARQSLELPLPELLEGFSDLSYAYRFGPAPYEAVRVALRAEDGTELAHDFHFLLGHRRLSPAELGLMARGQVLADGNLSLELHSAQCARFVTVRVPGFLPEDQYFHLAPDVPRRLLLHSLGVAGAPAGEVLALNSLTPREITFDC